MKRVLRWMAMCVLLTCALTLTGCEGTTYVGVGVSGPWVGYPYGGYPYGGIHPGPYGGAVIYGRPF